MPQSNDLFIVERAGVQYQISAFELADFVGAVNDLTVADIAARDTLSDLRVGDRVFVVNAVADKTVSKGWAIYRVNSLSPLGFDKIQEQESLDITVIADVDLGYRPSLIGGAVTNSAGKEALLPPVTLSHAGLATPDMLASVHPAAYSGGTTATNPVQVDEDSQAVSFSINRLSRLP